MNKIICMFLSFGILTACQSSAGTICSTDSCAKIPEITAESFTAITIGSCTDKNMGTYMLIHSDGTNNPQICGKTLDCYRVDKTKYLIYNKKDCAEGGEYAQFHLNE